jgi:leader peptidase (prepilin peptidase) / N-methyltransferase
VTAVLVGSCALLGLAIGSFLNVVIWRVPRKESVVSPPSHCPQCERPIRPIDNIPLFSWVLLRGQCRHCGTRIAVRYPLVELATAGLFVGAALRFGLDWALPGYLLFFAALLAISVIDLEHYIVPNRIIWPTGLASIPLLVLAAAAGHQWGALRSAAIGGAAAWAFLFIVHMINPRGMGFGDVRLAAVIGLYLGWLGVLHVALGLFLAFLGGSLVGVALILIRRKGMKSALPFGPFLAAGAAVAVFAGHPLLHGYLHG